MTSHTEQLIGGPLDGLVRGKMREDRLCIGPRDGDDTDRRYHLYERKGDGRLHYLRSISEEEFDIKFPDANV